MMASQVYTYDTTNETVHFKHVQFIIHQLHFNKAVKNNFLKI